MNWDLLIQLLVNGLIVGMLYGVVAMCFTLIYKSTQVVNFAQGEFLVLGAWICWYFIVKWQLPFVAAFAFALAAVFNDETITPQILLFAAGVVATVAISTRTRGRKAPDRSELTSVPGVTPPATTT